MKKIIFVMMAVIIGISANAQLTNTKWKGVLQLENETDVVFDFRTDTLEAVLVEDNSTLELMQYSVKDDVLSIQKISGQSTCSETSVARYKFEMKDDSLVLTLIEDECSDRSSVLDNTEWVKE